MPIEIERKFLLANDHWRLEVYRRCHMLQGYLFSRPVAADEITALAAGAVKHVA